ncbi:MAG: hypothetical protein HKN58_00035 [Xanthomonadales bacterium]|nr:hypothetical protein [Xanthomonadales bacterium]
MSDGLTPTFRPTRLGPCFCDSGKRFKDCCGSVAPGRPPPQGVHVVREFVDPDTCRSLVDYLSGQPRKPLGTIAQPGSSEFMEAEYSPDRVTDDVEAGEMRGTVNETVKRAMDGPIAEATGRPFAWFEKPQLLRYEPGGRYAMHADSEILLNQPRAWFKNIDRDISLLIYLNDDFDGGTLEFTKFNYIFRPRVGDLVFFPSDHRYLHEAMPVTRGLRWVIVSWAAFADEPKVLDQPIPESIPLKA